MSPVMRVSLAELTAPHTPPLVLPKSAILKLYDRRCMNNYRQPYDSKPPISYTPAKEVAYRRYLAAVADGSLPDPTTDFEKDHVGRDSDSDSDEDNEEGEEKKSKEKKPKKQEWIRDGKFEANLHHRSQKMFRAEKAAYDRLFDLQGTQIPKLYGVVKYVVKIPAHSPGIDGDPAYSDGPDVRYIEETIPGLLLEDISPGLTLRDLIYTWTKRSPAWIFSKEVLWKLCEQAVAVVDRVGDFEVLNEDVRMDNFIIREPFLAPGPNGDDEDNEPVDRVLQNSVVLIDLTHCKLKGEEDEVEWARRKASQDEEGAVGHVARMLVNRHVEKGAWTYVPSGRWDRWCQHENEDSPAGQDSIAG